MLNSPIQPPAIMASELGPALPPHRAADLPNIVSLEIRRLFPDIPQEIYLQGDDLSPVRAATENALASVDMSMIRPKDSVNVLCSEHGFAILGGEPYAEMLRTIKDVVEERTGGMVRLRFCVGAGLTEAREEIPYYRLDEYFEGRVKATHPWDRGVAIETEIGTLYGLACVYDADWIIPVHYDDPRELYLHRLLDRSLKCFTMSFARFETRSIYHMNFGTRSSNIVPRAIFQSPFVQEKFAFSCVQVTSPAGITGVEADNNYDRLNERLIRNTLRGYGKLIRLFSEIDECVAVLDAGRWPWYLHGGGLTCGNLFEAPIDHLDLDVGYAEKSGHLFNTSVKALVVNHAWRDNFVVLAMFYPTFIAGREVAQGLSRHMAKYCPIADNLEHAMQMAFEKAVTDKAILFDGSYGSINLTPSMGEFFIEKAPAVASKVDQELMPKWLKQRGIDPDLA